MLFLIAGILKPGSEDRLVALHNEFNEHLAQPFRKIALFGALRDKDGSHRGYLSFIEAKDFADAESYLHQSPFYEHELYERVEVAQFEPEVGSIGD
jgi:uncharacterized protein YciI